MKDVIVQCAKDLGIRVVSLDLCSPMRPGQVYLAHRNGPVKLLTCDKDDRENGWVVCKELDYSYNTTDCYCVVEDSTNKQEFPQQ